MVLTFGLVFFTEGLVIVYPSYIKKYRLLYFTYHVLLDIDEIKPIYGEQHFLFFLGENLFEI